YANWEGKTTATLSLGDILQKFRPVEDTDKKGPQACGLAALDGKLYVSYGGNARGKEQPSGDVILVLDAATGELIKDIRTPNPGELKTGADGKLYLVSAGTTVSVI